MRRIGITASSVAPVSGPRVALTQVYTANSPSTVLTISGLAGYQAGRTDVTIIVNQNVFLWGGLYGLFVTGANPNDTVRLVNSGYIIGKGGNGGALPGGVGGDGLPALKLGCNLTVENTSTGWICGGGGGGGLARIGTTPAVGGGGGAGGGQGGYNLNTNGGAGQPGDSGVNGTNNTVNNTVGGGGGGRKFKTNAGVEDLSGGAGGVSDGTTLNAVGFGGFAAGGGASRSSGGIAITAGGGGGWGAPGGSGFALDVIQTPTYPINGGNGGSYGAVGQDGSADPFLSTEYFGGLGGKAIDFNGYTCTIIGSQINILGARE